MDRLTVRGKYLYARNEKFFARGVSYGPFTPNSRGERYPEPERADADFAIMRDLGVNLGRVYVPPPAWMFELARKHELRLMVGMPWPFHMAFLDSAEMTRDIRKTISDGVAWMREFSDVIFAYSLGNEIRSDIVRWHGPHAVNKFLRELYDIGKQTDPDGLFTFSNYPSAEYLDLNFLDIVSFNVYLHREVDFRRYLTHLLATTYDRPLVLSETGMDTLREGEAHQAELLKWQARASFELGLSGFIVFAFTDEWHTGGAEITDWAFGLVTRDRKLKLAFDAVSEVFKYQLPPPLPQAPKASVVVCAYNAAGTLGACLESLKHLNYPDYEVLVIDDGSTDSTPQIATSADVRLVRLEHNGLGAARNRGIVEAYGRIVAFIDADAEADRDWLYHLVETLERTGAVAAGGQNFPPAPQSAREAAIAAAPGEPREVCAGDDALDQVCGCSMALDKSRLPDLAPFDKMFTTAGDDVDFSWAMHERGLKLAYAPGAMVIHRRRTTIRTYLRQQAGYGRGEAILARKYPNRMTLGRRVYGNPGWVARWFGGGPRVYYGAFGRGLFQSLYRGSDSPLTLATLVDPRWVVLSLIALIIGGFLSRAVVIAGAVGLLATLAGAVAMAAGRKLAPQSSLAARALLALLCLLGNLVRGWKRASRLRLAIDDNPQDSSRRLQRQGELVLSEAIAPTDDTTIQHLCDAVRLALLRRRATVAVSDSYQPYDLQVRTSSGVVANLNLLNRRDGRIVVGWKLGWESRRVLVSFASCLAIFILLVAVPAGLSVVYGVPFAIVIVGLRMVYQARQLPPLIELAAADITRSLAVEATQPDKRGAA